MYESNPQFFKFPNKIKAELVLLHDENYLSCANTLSMVVGQFDIDLPKCFY
jgi:hypothetical protein